MCANRSKSTGKWGLCYLAAVFCCDLFFAFYFRRQPGGGWTRAYAPVHWPTGGGKVCVWRRKLYVSFQCDSVFVCEGEERGKERGCAGHVAFISHHISELVLPFFVAFPSPRSLSSCCGTTSLFSLLVSAQHAPPLSVSASTFFFLK